MTSALVLDVMKKHIVLRFLGHVAAVWVVVLGYDALVERESQDPVVLGALLTGGLALSMVMGAYLTGVHLYDSER